MRRVAVVAIDMGYGHLRAAQPLADALGQPLLELDRPPIGDAFDARSWRRARFVHEQLSRASQWPVVGRPFLALMDAYTHIAPLPSASASNGHAVSAGVDLSRSTLATRGFARLADRGLGGGLVERLRRGEALLSTFYAPSLIADRAGLPSFCLVTDADCHRIWVPDRPAKTRITYFAPSDRVHDRLLAYGVPAARIVQAGFPLPLELLGGPELPALERNLAARLGRLQEPNKQSILIVFAIGGAGAQLPLAHAVLRGLAPLLREGRVRLALVAGLRGEVAARLQRWTTQLQLEGAVEVVHEETWQSYYRRFNALLARADALWTKPSEMAFYAALGLPLILAPPVGAHERYNARWVLARGAALEQQEPAHVARWLSGWLADGSLARAAQAGRSFPADGVYRIASAVTNNPD